MGISLTAKNTDTNLSCSAHTFQDLRLSIAKSKNEALGKIYEEFLDQPDLEKENTMKELLKNDMALYDFLIHCDCEGTLSSDTCKSLLESLKDVNITKNFIYEEYYASLIALLHHCEKENESLIFS